MDINIYKNKKSRHLSKRTLLIACGAAMAAVLVIFAIILIINQTMAPVRIFDFGRVVQGVSVNGVNISGMARREAYDSTASIEKTILDGVVIKLDVNGEEKDFTAYDLAVGTDYQSVMIKAMNYGHTGAFSQRKQEIDKASAQGMDFAVKLASDSDSLSAALASLKTRIDKPAINASAQFMPWGYFPDGSPYTPDMDEMISTSSKLKALTYPENLVRTPVEQMPVKTRYQFWENTKYKADYMPGAANISRFLYVDEQTGIDTDTAAIAGELMSQIQSGTFSLIKVPVTVTEPTVHMDEIKKNTQLITSWTSSYSLHKTSSRVWNVAKMSGIICGVEILPGVTWSINEQAGDRTLKLGWKAASGILDGGYTDQPGGGVCQISSTLFNAAIRAGLDTQSRHHSIVSGYMPKGMDATISTGGPDLKLTNNYAGSIYIVSYMTPEDKTITVEIYGAPLIDPATGAEVIYDFTPGNVTTYGNPVMRDIWDATVLPDKNPVLSGETIVYAEVQYGMKVTTYKIFRRLDGTEYDRDVFENVNVSPIDGKTYHGYPDPATVSPAPSESAPTSPSP